MYKVTLYLEDELLKKVVKESKIEKRSMSNTINYLLNKYFELLERKK